MFTLWNKPHLAGLLNDFLSEHDPDDAVKQLDKNYQHGGGWRDFNGFRLVGWENVDRPGSLSIVYHPDDPPLQEIARAKLRDELVVLFDYGWVMVRQPKGQFRIARMD